MNEVINRRLRVALGRVRTCLEDDRGSAGISSFFAVMILLTLLSLGVAGMRTFIAMGDVSAATRAGALSLIHI